MSMNNNHYDEYQMLNRQKIAVRTLAITLTLVFLNGLFSTATEWAAPMIQALVILTIAAGYFVTCAIFKDAYLSRKIKNSYVSVFSFSLLGILNVWQSFHSLSFLGRAHLIHDGKLGDGFAPLLLGLFFLYCSVITLIKVILERRQNDKEE